MAVFCRREIYNYVNVSDDEKFDKLAEILLYNKSLGGYHGKRYY